MTATGPFGIDEAGCNGQVYWSVAKAHNVIFGAARATISWGYQDKWFPSSWAGMKQLSICRFAYHVLYPAQPIPAQCDNFLRVVHEDWDNAYPVDDVELLHGCSKAQLTDAICSWDEYIAARAPKPVDYSRKQFLDDYTELGEWRKQRKWWLAQFLNDRSIEDPRPPDLPVGAENWLIHQNADHYPAWPGLSPGSLSLDTNRWNEAYIPIATFFGEQPPVVKEWPNAITDWARTLGYTGPGPE
jgi:GH25 family lysozyme M1 (1,4-beta-N-acetylmuramidase)